MLTVVLLSAMPLALVRSESLPKDLSTKLYERPGNLSNHGNHGGGRMLGSFEQPVGKISWVVVQRLGCRRFGRYDVLPCRVS